MDDRTDRVPEGSAAYREFTRLYALARSIRPTAFDGWNRELFATTGDQRGCFNTRTGAIRVSGRLLGECVNGPETGNPRRRAQALATVLRAATHAGMELDAPAERNAVRTAHSLAVVDGFAHVRAAEDFRIFTEIAGHRGLAFSNPQYDGAFTATQGLLQQASGPRVDRQELISRLAHGPGVMHFDHLADAVLQNRLAEVVPFRAEDRRAVRAALIGTMLHPQWESLAQRPAETGAQVASQIGQALNAKVEEIRYRHHHASRTPSPDSRLTPAAEPATARLNKQSTTADPHRPAPEAKFLTGLAPAANAVDQKPLLGDGARGAGLSRSLANANNKRLSR
jgi:hypothetical protein